MDIEEKFKIFKEKGYTYNYKTGIIYNSRKSECINNDKGYIKLITTYNKKKINLLGHRFAWFFYYNEAPKQALDHIDRNKTNNKISNLRLTTATQNSENRNGVLGVCYCKDHKKYRAKIVVNGKAIFLGYFDNEEDGVKEYYNAKNKYHKYYKNNNND